MRLTTLLLLGTALLSVSACNRDDAAGKLPATAPSTAVAETTPDTNTAEFDPAALHTITADALMDSIHTLSSDEFQGRLPGTVGEEKTVAYLVKRYQAMGLKPGNPDGSYVQKVPMVGITGHADMQLSAGKQSFDMQRGTDFVATTSRFVPKVSIKDSPLLFVGYGVQAPEYGWDDYKGVDVHGKTLVMLINDPAVPDPNDPGKLDDAIFRGKAMTYYGRWTYKYDIASKLGADGVIIIHETGPAGYPWAVVENSWTGEQFELAAEDRNMGRVPVQSWITLDKAKALLKACGQDFDALKQAAVKKDFHPIPLNAKVSVTIDNQVREIESQNVVARLPGSDPEMADETVIYSAHWDHLGKIDEMSGDNIFNGARDNASGVAGVLAIAQAFADLPTAPKRSMLFMNVTGEEQGLLGSRYYASYPLYPLAKTVAMFNFDSLNPWGPTRDMQVIGTGQNTLEDSLRSVLDEHNRVVIAEQEPEKGYYYRSDQFEFAKVGVPALYPKGGVEVIGKPEGYGMQKRREYIANDYHKPSDEIKDDWDLSGMAQDMRVMAEVGYRVAQNPVPPEWKPGSEFKSIRDAQLAK